MSIERDITHHGTGVLAWCAWNERRQRPGQDDSHILWMDTRGYIRWLRAAPDVPRRIHNSTHHSCAEIVQP